MDLTFAPKRNGLLDVRRSVICLEPGRSSQPLDHISIDQVICQADRKPSVWLDVDLENKLLAVDI